LPLKAATTSTSSATEARSQRTAVAKHSAVPRLKRKLLIGIGDHQQIKKASEKQKMSSRPQTADDKGTNVKVVVRCRPFSLSEKVREKVSPSHNAVYANC
jgi:hypothetical protein